MTKKPPLVLDNAAARRIFLHAHALSHAPADGTDILALIRRLGFVQLDSIQTVARAHHHILHSRSSSYAAADLARLHGSDRALFEHWTHDASIIPIEHYPHWRIRFARTRQRVRDNPVWAERLGSRRILKRVLDRIRENGPLMARDFEDPGTPGEMWGWSRSKSALEYLWRTGVLAIPRRDSGFQKVYDLTERSVPADLLGAAPSKAETVDWACRAALERLGFATPREITNFWALILFEDVERWVERNRRNLVTVSLEGTDGKHVSALALPEVETWRDTAPSPPPIMRALNPFDPAIRDRKRLKRLFGFDYTIEIFVPEVKRKFGYYVYPLLDGDRFVGRVDAKTDRAADALAVRRIWHEPGVRTDAAFKARQAEALRDLARFGGTAKVVHAR
ncbi:MAG: YcaQ family DNA glycosylase [Alphaproteobacteria bacterium]|nr:YcaQ family DNA glycosylase [Alphaproteobacteria bacterium]